MDLAQICCFQKSQPCLASLEMHNTWCLREQRDLGGGCTNFSDTVDAALQAPVCRAGFLHRRVGSGVTPGPESCGPCAANGSALRALVSLRAFSEDQVRCVHVVLSGLAQASEARAPKPLIAQVRGAPSSAAPIFLLIPHLPLLSLGLFCSISVVGFCFPAFNSFST